MRKSRTQKGITLVSLITTVIVLCILAATAIGSISRDGIISKAQTAANKFNQVLKHEEEMLKEFEGIFNDSWTDNNSGGVSNNAAPEDAFLWKSDDSSSPDYGVVIGYTENIQNYPSLRFPDRCTKIAIEFPENIDGSIKSEMRSYTHNIKKIELPNTVTEIGAESFYSYEFRSLTTIIIPNSVTTIGERAFSGCSSLKTITIGSGVTTIGDYAFSGCSGLTAITIPDSVTTIGMGAFSGCSSLKTITIGSGVTTIGERAFSYCSSLKTITIGSGVTTIGEYSFSFCSSLESITIPDSVTTIGDYAFYYCGGLTTIIFNGTIAQWNQIEREVGWNRDVPAIEVICTNGKVSLKALVSKNVNDISNQIVTTNTTVYDEYENKIVVPAGFKIRVDDSTNNATRVTEGIVIEHGTDGNQFVWVPVGKIYTDTAKTESLAKTITLGRYESFTMTDGVYYTPTQTAGNYANAIAIGGSCTEDTSINHKLDYKNVIARDIGAFVTSATTNGGYYIGRFEAGNSNDTLVCKYGQTVYENITQPEASSLSRSMYADGYSTGTFSSDLINSYAWDTAIIFIQTFGTKSNSHSYAKTSGASGIFESQTTGTSILSSTSSVDEQLNIYDMAGNCYEWSTETSNAIFQPTPSDDPRLLPCVLRGGIFDYTYTRSPGSEGGEGEMISFRPLIYVAP